VPLPFLRGKKLKLKYCTESFKTSNQTLILNMPNEYIYNFYYFTLSLSVIFTPIHFLEPWLGITKIQVEMKEEPFIYHHYLI
jgi:hypothetical protein